VSCRGRLPTTQNGPQHINTWQSGKDECDAHVIVQVIVFADADASGKTVQDEHTTAPTSVVQEGTGLKPQFGDALRSTVQMLDRYRWPNEMCLQSTRLVACDGKNHLINHTLLALNFSCM
jgi:hypothetical protein